MRQARYRYLLLCIVLFALCLPLALRAQENAELTGAVKDPSGAVIPNATISIVNVSTGETRSTSSNAAGLYDFAGLNHGTYTLKIDAKGFSKYQKTGIVMNVAATIQENATLEVGASSQTITVEADALHLQTETNEVSSLISGEQLTQIATNGRNMVSLTTLGTGVSNNLGAFNGVTAQGSGFGLSFNGMRPDHNDWLIDGGEAYDRGSGGKFDLMPTMDALAEFQTLSSNYSPDYGISSGGTITMVLKSGTKTFHGGAWEFNRNDAFDAAAYFAKQQKLATPELRLNIFGFDIGGPVFIPGLYPKSKSKTYFFESEEWRRFIQGANPSTANTVPLPDFPAANQALNYQPWNELAASNGTGSNKLSAGVCAPGVPAPCVPGYTSTAGVGANAAYLATLKADNLVPGQPFPNNVIPANLIDQNTVRFMSTGALPKPTNNDPTNPQTVASPKQPTFVREDVVRIDHDITDKYRLMGHWIHDQMSNTQYPAMWDGDSYDTVGTVFGNPSWASVIKLTQTLSPTVLNETSFDVNGNTIQWSPAGIYNQPSGWTAVPLTGFQGIAELPAVAFSGNLNTEYSLNYDPWHNAFLDYQIRDDLSWNRGKHGLKFGFSFMRMDKNQEQQALVQGTYNFGSDYTGDAYLNMLLGLADKFTQLKQLTTAHWVNNTYSFYGMDNWHVTPRLTLNVGLRYDVMPRVYEKFNRVSNFNPALYNPSQAQTPNPTLNPSGPGVQTINNTPFYMNGIALAGQNGTPQGLVNNDFNTLEPRVGLAYDLFGTGKTILRTGGGLFYERVQGNDIYGLSSNAPFAVNAEVDNVFFTNPNNPTSGATSTGTVLNPSSPGTLITHYPNPGTAQFSLGVQQQLQPSIVGVVQYVGSIGWDQNDERAINTVPLGDLADRQTVATGGTANLYRTYRGYGGITATEAATNSNYNSLQAGLRIENKHNLTAQFSYTWSHEIDIASGDEGSTNFNGGQSYLSNPFNPRYDRGSGVLDRRHIFNVNYDYKLPFFQNSGNLLAHEVLGGWEFSGVTVAEAGSPQETFFNATDTLGLGGTTVNRPNVSGSTKGPKTQQAWFKTSVFSAPTAPWAGGTNQGFGNAAKDAVVGPGLFNWNMSLFKSLPLTPHEGPRIELRFESFNTFNHTEFQNLDLTTNDKNFGQTTSAYDPRVMQFGAKFIF